jgi:hypothetical protein
VRGGEGEGEGEGGPYRTDDIDGIYIDGSTIEAALLTIGITRKAKNEAAVVA